MSDVRLQLIWRDDMERSTWGVRYLHWGLDDWLYLDEASNNEY